MSDDAEIQYCVELTTYNIHLVEYLYARESKWCVSVCVCDIFRNKHTKEFRLAHGGHTAATTLAATACATAWQPRRESGERVVRGVLLVFVTAHFFLSV